MLSGGLNIWLIKTFDWTLIKKSKVACKLLPFFIYTILDFSVAIIVIMTGHKVYAVSSPINASQRKFDRKIPTIIILVALVICFSINSHFLVSHSLLEFHELKLIDNVYYIHLIKVCTHKMWITFYDMYWSYIDATIYSFLPFFLLSIFNTLIILRLVKEKRGSLRLQKPENVSVVSHEKSEIANDRNLKKSTKLLVKKLTVAEYNSKNSLETISVSVKKIRNSSKNNNKRLTITILLINISFCVLTMPIVILQIADQLDANNQMDNRRNRNNTKILEKKVDKSFDENYFNMIKALFELLQYLNHSINFFLYCLCVKTFRNETKLFLLSIFRKK